MHILWEHSDFSSVLPVLWRSRGFDLSGVFLSIVLLLIYNMDIKDVEQILTFDHLIF